MRKSNIILPIGIFFISVLLLQCSGPSKQEPDKEFYSTDDYPNVEKYDVHVHINTDKPYFINHSKQDNFRMLSMNVDVADYPPIEQQRAYAIHQLKNFPDRFAYATTFTVKTWNDKDWQAKSIAYLKESFEKGAIAVKVWKNIGMELKDKSGGFVMIDNPRIGPVLDFIDSSNKTLVGHLGEPKNCWLPLKEMTVRNDREYFMNHPQYHMYLHPEYPSYQDQIDARDRMLDKHPDLLFIGAHLGSLEWDVDELARRLDKYPKMAVETAARLTHLQHQAIGNYDKVRDFFITYQDRVLYGTDSEVNDSMDSAEVIKSTHEARLLHWKFFTSDEFLQASEVNGKFKGLHLPREVVDKIYFKNALKWLPGAPGG